MKTSVLVTLLFSLTIVAFFLCLFPPASAFAASNPIMYWSFDNPADPGHDDTGGGNNGTVVGATWTSQGKVNGALQFDGHQDYVEIPDHPSQTGMSKLMIDAWIYPTDDVLPPEGYHMVIVGKWGPSTCSDDSYNLVLNREGEVLKPSFTISNGTVAGTLSVTAGTPVPLRQWTHVAGVYDGLRSYIWINGQQAAVSSTQVPGIVVQDTSLALKIGMSRMDSSANYNEFCGKIDEVAIYDVPEPCTLFLLALGGMGLLRRRRG